MARRSNSVQAKLPRRRCLAFDARYRLPGLHPLCPTPCGPGLYFLFPALADAARLSLLGPTTLHVSKRRVFFFSVQRASTEPRISRNSPAFSARGITGCIRAFSSSASFHPRLSRSRGHRYLYGLLFISRPRLKMLSNEAEPTSEG